LRGNREAIVMATPSAQKLPTKPTFLPVILGGIVCLVSLIIISIHSLKSGTPLIYFAYLCTPFIPIGGLALARATDIKGRSNSRFDIAKSDKVLKMCSALAVVGFLIAIPVMIEIANRFSQV
jgi:hypothetical protein